MSESRLLTFDEPSAAPAMMITGTNMAAVSRAFLDVYKRQPKVIELFLDEESQHLAGLSEFIGKPVSLQSESAMGQEQYDIVLM